VFENGIYIKHVCVCFAWFDSYNKSADIY